MSEIKTKFKNQTLVRAWRKILKDLLAERVHTARDRQELAKKMGVSAHYIHSMLYRKEVGGLDAWASALSAAYGVKRDFINDLSLKLCRLKMLEEENASLKKQLAEKPIFDSFDSVDMMIQDVLSAQRLKQIFDKIERKEILFS